LEQQGCTVLASEFNDFQKPLDRHSYDACGASIEKADYFTAESPTKRSTMMIDDGAVSDMEV
jgi:hypothetical protein